MNSNLGCDDPTIRKESCCCCVCSSGCVALTITVSAILIVVWPTTCLASLSTFYLMHQSKVVELSPKSSAFKI